MPFLLEPGQGDHLLDIEGGYNVRLHLGLQYFDPGMVGPLEPNNGESVLKFVLFSFPFNLAFIA